VILRPIGFVRCGQADKVDAARQPAAAQDAPGRIELLPDPGFEHALEDLSGWERIWVLYWFDRNTGWRPKVLPPRSTTGRKGVFATRSPHRPNPIGLSCVRLLGVDGLVLEVRGVDMLDGTPVLDLKPYVPYTDSFPDAASGWLDREAALAAGAADPVQPYAVAVAALAEQQFDWIRERGDTDLRERVCRSLALGPQPHPYRRIRREADGSFRLAVRDWRIRFRLDGRVVQVESVASGYRAAQLAAPGADPRLLLQAAFRAQWS
jgi:tRNA-Thr(GGU) m(6)t(6)A37 methyltransferase TsaA